MIRGHRAGIGTAAAFQFVSFRAIVAATTFSFAFGLAARADAAPTPAEVAIAQGLYDAAKKLMGEGRFLEASAKLEDSMRLDPAIGTQYQLADCYEHVGKTASAWAAYLQVAASAHGAGTAERERVARGRAKALEVKVPHLVIAVPIDSRTNDLEVKRDGTVVGSAQYDTMIPLDPGPHTISATARGKAWEEHTTLTTDGATTKITIPIIGEDPTPPPIVATVSPLPPVRREEPPAETPSDGSTQRAIALVTGSVGLVGIGLGTYFGVSSMSKNSDAKAECDARGCSPAGVTLREDAISAGNVSTIAFVAGGALFVGGVVLYLTAPTRSSSTGSALPARHFRVGVAPRGVFAGGSF